MTPWVDIATLTQPKGVKGRLGARMAPGLSVSLEGLTVFCAPPALEGPRHRRIVDEGECGDGERWVEFSDVATRDDARALSGRHCFARRDDLAHRLEETCCPGDEMPLESRVWTSWSVVDVDRGFSGEVVEVQPRPMQPLLVVEDAGGRRMMVPLAAELVVEIDERRRRLVMTLPSGLEALTTDG